MIQTRRVAPLCLVGRLLAATWMSLSSGCGESQSATDSANTAVTSSASDQRTQPEESKIAGSAAAATPWFEQCAEQRGLRFTHDSGHRGHMLFPEIVCGGTALFDMDGDGDLDAFFVQSGQVDSDASKRSPSRLFRNRGDGTFDDVTDDSGADVRGYGMGVAAGDYDNDGDVDLYVTCLGPDVLLRNQGDGRFTDVTTDAGVGDPSFGASAGFVDFDHDGDLDLLVANYVHWSPSQERECFSTVGHPDYCSPNAYKAPARDTLYRNNGDGTFTDVSEQAGLTAAFGNGLGVGFADFNADGWVDLLVANDGLPNQLWVNQGNGTFVDRAWESGCAVDESGTAKAGMGVAINDLDDDGDFDLLIVNMQRETDSLLRNEGGYFVDMTRTRGLAALSKQFTRFGVGLVDFNNDGWLDLFEANGKVRRLDETSHDRRDVYAEPNLLYRGTPAGRFEEVQPRGGTDPVLIATGRAAAFGDIDNDGRVDILVVNRDGPARLLRNIVADADHWIVLRVVEEHGRDALGATVSLKIGDRIIMRSVQTAGSYCAASDPRVHVGLGAAEVVRDVTVRWVDGTTETFGDLAADQIMMLRRGGGSNAASKSPRDRVTTP